MKRACRAILLFVAWGCGGGSSGSQPADVAAAPQNIGSAAPTAPQAGMAAVQTPPATGTTGGGAAMTPDTEFPPGMAAAGTAAPEPAAGAGPAEPAGQAGSAGSPAAGTGGMQQPVPGGGTPSGGGTATPTVPELTAECPTFRDGTITFMGLGGIRVAAGSKASEPTAPMVFYWHGTGSFAGEYATMAGAVHRGVVEEGGVLISFQGTTGGDLLSGTFIFGAGDFELADQLFACAVRDHNVDPHRVFATGCSAGGLFSGAMAAARSTYIAAAAPNSGGWTAPVRFQNDYTPALMTVHGAAGVDVVVVDFSRTSATADMAFKGRGGFVVNCDHGGLHCGGGPLAPDMWEFFKAHPYGVDPHPWAGGLPSGFNGDCEIY